MARQARASADRRRVTNVSPVWLKAPPCASFSVKEEIKPHKVRYYLERRDAEFEPKMAEVLCVYREVQVLKKAAAKAEKSNKPVAIVSYDEGSLESRPSPRRHRICRQCQAAMRASRGIMSSHKRHGTLSLLAGIDLTALTGKVHALVRERHRSREFIEFPQASRCRLSGQHRDQADPRQSFRTHFEGNSEPGSTPGRQAASTLPFTPKHGSWLR